MAGGAKSVVSRMAVLFAAAVIAGAAAAQDKPVDAGPYVPSPDSAVAAMLREAGVGPGDYLIDLGSGDGRIVRTAALVFGARGMGVEIQDRLVEQSNELARKEGIADRVRFVRQDLFKTDISQASVVTIYLLPHTVNQLRGKLLAELKPGTRVVSHDYALAGWTPHKKFEMDLEEKVGISGVTRTLIYVYVIPVKLAGRWTATLPPSLSRTAARMDLRQEGTTVSGEMLLDGTAVPLLDARLAGDDLSFRLAGREAVFRGRVEGGAIRGTVESRRGSAPWSATTGG